MLVFLGVLRLGTCTLYIFKGLAQICAGSGALQHSRENEKSNDSDDDSVDVPCDDSSPDFLTKKLEFMFRIYDLDR